VVGRRNEDRLRQQAGRDRRELAFIHVAGGRRRLVTANLDGSDLTVITSTLERDVNDPEWSPDGTRLAFSDTTDVYVVNVDGSNLRNLTSSPAELGRANNPSWSPDGGRIAYFYVTSIKVVAADGTGATTLASNLGELWELSWSPDGQKIAFVNDMSGPLQEELFIVNSDGSALTRTGIDVATTLDWGRAPAAPPAPPPPHRRVTIRAGQSYVARAR
jgi:Tol biopolymer transport system component